MVHRAGFIRRNVSAVCPRFYQILIQFQALMSLLFQTVYDFVYTATRPPKERF